MDGINITTDDKHMWLIPFNIGLSHTIMITLPKPSHIKAVKIYNYNKSIEDSYRGAKVITISVGNKLVTPKRGIIVRKAPGNALFDFGCVVKIPFSGGWEGNEIAAYSKQPASVALMLQEYDTPQLPTGFTFEFVLYSTYGDMHYIGLNGLEIYDLFGRPLLQNNSSSRNEYQITATPASVQIIKGMENDTRTVDKLVDGINETGDDRHMWLAPFRNTKFFAVTNREVAKSANVITVTFNSHVAISAIKLWNYVKTPSRGVQEFAIFCDSRIIYRVNIPFK